MAPSETSVRDQESPLLELAEEMRALVRYGLPVRADRAGPHLLALPAVRARAVDPADRASLARALELALREELDRLNHELAPAARLLLGTDPATAGARLTVRRQAAAQASGYEVHHFRKRIEPKIWDLLTGQLGRAGDASVLVAPVLHPARRPLVLPADVFAWEAVEHQQALAALWGAVYLLRAELLAVAALVSMDADRLALDAAAERALWRHALVLHAAASYRAAYGQVLLHTAADYGQVLLHTAADPGPAPGPDEIAASAGWTPELTPAQELLLAELADPEAGLPGFATALTAARGGRELAKSWRAALTGRTPEGTGPDQEEEGS
ncbi:hypothetical protein [Actinomadura violacea]|uniref:Uncharacterized protein n=1 Tax=Actinomadura violacea TaxID=2819934 RepID=A0ABS3S0D3_9ACTN|nr:hypothetical protein [Actinomadura violacea]MBO2461543.1 hypothetical protein [Actinomadura violacea]MBO2461754.1 hypothetical protein [Actinomadura violacea]